MTDVRFTDFTDRTTAVAELRTPLNRRPPIEEVHGLHPVNQKP